MKKMLLGVSLLFLLASGLVACGSTTTDEVTTSVSTPGADVTSVLVFTDPVLEGLIRKAMNKPDGDITVAEAKAVTQLDLQMEGGIPIARVADISDLKYFPNLTSLNLGWALYDGDNAVALNALAGLTKLECLYVACCNIADISPLEGLTEMKDLQIWGNEKITDISALAGMTQMESLWIKGCQITDLAPLAGMANLTTLFVEGNPITDYSPIADIYPGLSDKDFDL
jgi:hypothetical protein